jgi:hypothetical protein
MLRKLKQRFCSHEYYLSTMTSRDKNGNVSNICIKCKKILFADCGLSLDGKFVARKAQEK